MPAFVKNAFPFHLTKRGAIDKETLDMLHVEICTVSNFTAVASKFSELAHKRHLQTLLEYAEYCVCRGLPREPAVIGGQTTLDGFVQQRSSANTDRVAINPNQTAEFFDYHPSANWLSDVFLETTKQPLQWMKQFMLTIHGQTLAMDHTFKICGSIRGADRQPLYTGCFTVMNELCQVAAQFMVQTKTWIEVKAGLELLYQRCQLLGPENPDVDGLEVSA
jgi:hypothetical protein